MHPTFISPELFHFVGRRSPEDHETNYALIKKVLADRCISHPPHNRNWGVTSYTVDATQTLASENFLVPNHTCYCDIPFNLLAPHLSKYGCFGASFSRHQLAKYGARPVIYVPCRPDDWMAVFGGKTVLDRIERLYRGAEYFDGQLRNLEPSADQKDVDSRSPAGSLRYYLRSLESVLGLDVLSFIKPFDSSLNDDATDYFYSEREWRKHGNLQFDISEVEKVVVHESFLERARSELPAFGDRVVSVG